MQVIAWSNKNNAAFFCYFHMQFSKPIGKIRRLFKHFQRLWIFKTEFKHFQGFLKHAMNPAINACKTYSWLRQYKGYKNLLRSYRFTVIYKLSDYNVQFMSNNLFKIKSFKHLKYAVHKWQTSTVYITYFSTAILKHTLWSGVH